MEPRYYCWAELDTRGTDWVTEAAAHNIAVLLRRGGPDGHIHLVPALDGDLHLLAGMCDCQPRARLGANGRTRIIHRSPIQRLKVPSRLPAKL